MTGYLARVGSHIECALKAFAAHRASYREAGDGLAVLDFRRPGTNTYALRVVFDRDALRGGAVYLSGDIGEAVVYPTCAATLQGMAECFTRREPDGGIYVNVPYFIEKVAAASDLFAWDKEDFIEDFKARCAELEYAYADQFLEEYLDTWGSDVWFDDRHGVTLGDSAREALARIDEDYWEWIYECGKRVHGRVVFWLVGLRLAWEQICEDEDGKEAAK